MKKAMYFLLDVFTDVRFGGNQLAVFPDSRLIDESIMQSIATELNLSETVFLYPKNEAGSYPMRIFTPGSELPTAGHPTIGTAFVLARESDIQNGLHTLHLDQKVGRIKVEITMEKNLPKLASMYQPLPEFGHIIEDRDSIAFLLGLESKALLDYPLQIVSCGVPYLMAPVRTVSDVASVSFRLDLWNKLKDKINAFVYVFAPEGIRPGSDLHGRMFAPEAGILEDPATGSANGPLGCYLTHYGIKHGPYVSEQGFEMGRPSILHIDIKKDESGTISQVIVSGQAVFVGSGEFYLD